MIPTNDTEGYTNMSLSEWDTRVDLEYIGEGLSGDYDPNDPNDRPLLRFSVYRFDHEHMEWEPVDGASYCTLLPADLNRDMAVGILSHILDTIRGKESIKRICAEMSWLEYSDAVGLVS